MLPFVQDVEFFLRRAKYNTEQDQHWEALLLYRKAVEVAPGDFRARQGLSDTYSNLGCNYTAMRCYLDGLWACVEQTGGTGLPGDFEYRLAHKFIAVEEYALGMRCFQRFLHDLNSADYIAERTLAEKLIYLWDETQEGSEVCVEEMEDLGAWLQVQSGLSLLRNGDVEGGIALLEEARDAAPENVEIALTLATSLWPLKDYREAVSICKEVIELEDDNLQAHCLLALIADETGDQALRKQEMLTLRTLAYYSPQDVFQAGMSLADLQDYEHAHFLFREGYHRAPNHVWMAHAYAACSMIVGQPSLASDVYMRLRRLMPENPTIFYYEQKCLRCQQVIEEKNILTQEFPLVFVLPEQDTEICRDRIAKLANPFVVVNLKQEGIGLEDLPMLLRWGLEREDGDWQRLALLTALRMEEKVAVSILKSYLVLPDIWCKAKRAACDILFCLRAEKEYVSWEAGGAARMYSDLAKAYIQTVEDTALPFKQMEKTGELSGREMRATVYLWRQYIQLSDQTPPPEEAVCYGNAMRLLAQNLCNREVQVLTGLRGCSSSTLERIQEVLEPHFLPVIEGELNPFPRQDRLFPGIGRL